MQFASKNTTAIAVDKKLAAVIPQDHCILEFRFELSTRIKFYAKNYCVQQWLRTTKKLQKFLLCSSHNMWP